MSATAGPRPDAAPHEHPFPRTGSELDAGALDDYLALLERPLALYRALLFFGASGSGKSSQIALLLERHPDLKDRRLTRMTADQRPGGPHDVLVIDELRAPADALSLLWARRNARTMLIASHVDPRWLAPLLLGLPSAAFRLDEHGGKLERHLQCLDVSYTAAALERFTQRFGANYTDLDIVLEASGERDLDRALARFLRQGCIEHGEQRR